MPLDVRGQLTDRKEIRPGFIGCGGHAFRNVYPTFQFAPVKLVATCDLQLEKAAAYAKQFGAERSYGDHRKMIEAEKLDAVFIVTNYDEKGRPRYVGLAGDALAAGLHVWMEKPPAASCEELKKLKELAGEKKVMTGFKKMFFSANVKAKELMESSEFGKPTLAQLQYPTYIPRVEEFNDYMMGGNVPSVVGFLDHLCHPVSLLLYLFGMPSTLFYQRTTNGAGVATFNYEDGRVATISLTHGAPYNAGAEHTLIVSDKGRSIEVHNNTRVSFHRDAPDRGYGTSPTYYVGEVGQTSSVWEPEFSLGQLYNKGLFLLGYFGEVNEFAMSIIENRPLSRCHLDHAIQATRIFEVFARGPGQVFRV